MDEGERREIEAEYRAAVRGEALTSFAIGAVLLGLSFFLSGAQGPFLREGGLLLMFLLAPAAVLYGVVRWFEPTARN